MESSENLNEKERIGDFELKATEDLEKSLENGDVSPEQIEAAEQETAALAEESQSLLGELGQLNTDSFNSKEAQDRLIEIGTELHALDKKWKMISSNFPKLAQIIAGFATSFVAIYPFTQSTNDYLVSLNTGSKYALLGSLAVGASIFGISKIWHLASEHMLNSETEELNKKIAGNKE